MWWIFPQMKGLGKSERSQFYGIPDRDQVRTFLEHPFLGKYLSKSLIKIIGYKFKFSVKIYRNIVCNKNNKKRERYAEIY